MVKKLDLQNFRSYSKKSFEFSEKTTLIVGPNASGKTNILEAIYALAIGKSFRAEEEKEVIREKENFTKILGITKKTELEIDLLRSHLDSQGETFSNKKLYKVNGIGKRQTDFVGNLRAVLFCPQDLEIATDSPSTRRRYLDLVLLQIFKDYRLANHIYEKALRQRNRLLWQARELRIKNYELSKQLEYWDKLLIENGKIIHEKRKDFLNFLELDYDSSIISEERLERYKDQEIAAAMTLVGPHRDDFKILKNNRNIKSFGSRGEQRLAVFDIKMGELAYVEKITDEKPVLLLDDIFSELDNKNRHKVLEVIPKQQTIMTTTESMAIKDARLVELS